MRSVLSADKTPHINKEVYYIKVTVDLQRPNFMIFFLCSWYSQYIDLRFGEKNKLKSFNDRKISGKNYFGEELMNN